MSTYNWMLRCYDLWELFMMPIISISMFALMFYEQIKLTKIATHYLDGLTNDALAGTFFSTIPCIILRFGFGCYHHMAIKYRMEHHEEPKCNQLKILYLIAKSLAWVDMVLIIIIEKLGSINLSNKFAIATEREIFIWILSYVLLTPILCLGLALLGYINKKVSGLCCPNTMNTNDNYDTLELT